QMKQKLHELEQKLAKLPEQRVVVQAEEPQKVEQDEDERPPVTKDWVAQLSNDHFQKAKKRWPELLQKVRETSVSVYAWLVDGKLVGATPDRVIVAFKSDIHRETTEKKENKAIIERHLKQVLGDSYQLETLMM